MAALDAGAEDVSATATRGGSRASPTSSTTSQAALEAPASTCCRPRVDDGVVDHGRGDRSGGLRKKVLRIVDAFEDNDDVQDVFGNFDISRRVMEAVG